MKYIFLVCGIILIAVSFAVYYMNPEKESKDPVIYWVTDANPARVEQINLFQKWLKKNNYPKIELRIDTANRQTSKKIIQCVSGVGGDCMDLSGGDMRYFHSMGLLVDVTDWGKELNFSPSTTWKAMIPEITIDSRQYQYPCNVSVNLYWVNKETFKKYNLPIPPISWTFDEFEKQGKEFVSVANKGKRYNSIFFLNQIDTRIMHRSLGLSALNESLTKCTLNDPRYIEVLKLKYKWTYKDRIIPSQADMDAVSTAAGYGGAGMQLFNSGNFAMYQCGRYALIQFRKFGKLDLAVIRPPYAEFENTHTATRANAIYAGSKNKELAKYFLSFLASKEYNMQIVDDADALPPNPKYTKIEEFLRPKKWPNEWGCHKIFADAMQDIAVGGAYSPFILFSVLNRITGNLENTFMAGINTAEYAAKESEIRINKEIKRNCTEDAELGKIYQKQLEKQKQIDALRKAGKKIPVALIDNPFYKKYYIYKGWAK